MTDRYALDLLASCSHKGLLDGVIHPFAGRLHPPSAEGMTDAGWNTAVGNDGDADRFGSQQDGTQIISTHRDRNDDTNGWEIDGKALGARRGAVHLQ